MKGGPIAQSALRQLFAARGAEMVLHDGWHAPARFGSVDAEVEAARTTVVVGELWGVGVLDVVGGDLGELAARLGVEQVPVGAAAAIDVIVAWGPELQPGGSAVRWLRLTREHARVLVPRAVVSAVREDLESAGGCLHATDISSGLTTLAVVGPRSPDLLARLVRLDLDPRTFDDRSVALTGAAGIPLQVLRWDRGPLLAYELTVGRDVAEYFWETLTHAGEGLGLQPIGCEALSRLPND